MARRVLAWCSLAAGLGFMAAVPASAQMADMTRATCGELLGQARADRAQLIIWLHGYYAGAAQRPTIDRSRLEKAAAALEEACLKERAMPLIGASARAILLDEPRPDAVPAPPVPSRAMPVMPPALPSRPVLPRGGP